MKIIGITGGVGCGKSELLKYLEQTVPCVVLRTDETAKELELPGAPCYDALVSLLRDAERKSAGTAAREADGFLLSDGRIDTKKMAAMIFTDDALLSAVNTLIHPAVEQAVLQKIREAGQSGQYEFFFIEAALLIEAGYEKYLDRLWYIYCDERVRRERLKASRGYSDEKIDGMFLSQLPEAVFRAHADAVIDNTGTLPSSFRQIDRFLQAIRLQTTR